MERTGLTRRVQIRSVPELEVESCVFSLDLVAFILVFYVKTIESLSLKMIKSCSRRVNFYQNLSWYTPDSFVSRREDHFKPIKPYLKMGG